MSDAAARLRGMIGGYRETALVGLAAQLNIADLLADRSATAVDLAERLGVDAGRLSSALRAMVAVGLLHQHDDGSFGNTAVSDLLRDESAARSAAIYFGSVSAPAFTLLRRGLSEDDCAFDLAMGTDFYSYLADHQDLAAHYHRIITVADMGSMISEAYSFGPGVVADIGGGSGMTLSSLLSRRPHLRGIVQDLPEALRDAPANLARYGVGGRCTLHPGDFFDRVVPGADCYLLTRVLANWADEAALLLLRNCRAVMSPGTRLLIIDLRMPPVVRAGSFVAIGDLQASAHFGGRIRTSPELTALVEKAGFHMLDSLPLGQGDGNDWWLHEAAPR